MTLAAPALVSLKLMNTGRSDLGSLAFDKEEPITVTLPEHVKVRALLRNDPEDLSVTIDGASIELGPHMLKEGSAWIVEVLVDSGDTSEGWINDLESQVHLGAEHLVDTRIMSRSPAERAAWVWLGGMLGGTILMVSGAVLGQSNLVAGLIFAAAGLALGTFGISRTSRMGSDSGPMQLRPRRNRIGRPR